MLLDNFTRAVSMEKRKALEQDEQARMKEMGVSRADAGNPLDPLLEALSRYKSEASTLFILAPAVILLVHVHLSTHWAY